MRAHPAFTRSTLVLLLAVPWAARADESKAPSVRVGEGGRFLVKGDGSPFFWLGDTAWELFHRLGREEAERYLENRARLGFTVIQAVAIGEFDGHIIPNAYGHLPLTDLDPARPAVEDGPENDYWDHVDWVVDRANAKGLTVGLLPTWGRYWHDKIKDGRPLFTRENAATYGEWIGRRYKDRGVIWILGGDRGFDDAEQKEVIRAMARGVRKGDGKTHLITFHPNGGAGSSGYFHEDDWLDVNMRQNGHGTEWTDRYSRTREDYDRNPPKPVLDGEPIYEGHPISFNAKKLGHSVASDVRRPFYWDTFGGAFGHTYGHHSVWQMWTPDREPINDPMMPWTEAIDQPGASQMIHGRRLLESRPFLSRIPDDSILVTDRVATSVPGQGRYRFVGTRDSDGSYAMVYAPVGRAFKVRMDAVQADRAIAWWFNPRDGLATEIGTYPARGERLFTPPDRGEQLDWVLILDDASKNYPPPGQVKDAPRADLSGRSVLITSVRTGDTEVFVVDLGTGDARNLSRSPGSEDRYPCWSPDGSRVAFISDRSGTPNLYVMDALGGEARRLFETKSVCYMPSWRAAPGGERIVFGMHGAKAEMASIRPDGSDLAMLGDGHDPNLSPDGTRICYTGDVPGGVGVFVMDADGRHKRRVIAETSGVGATFPDWSPDGSKLVYAYPVGKALELFVAEADGSNVRRLTHLNQVATPASWSPDGKWISFRLTDERYWSDPAKARSTYAEKPAAKRPVWVVRPDGSDAHAVEPLRFQCAIDGSRAAWKP